MSSRAMTTMMRSVIVACLAVTGAVLIPGCAGGGGELTPAAAGELVTAHPDFQSPANLGVYGGTPELLEVTSVTPEGSGARVEFTWVYQRNFQATKGNVPSTLYYTRMLDGRPRTASATLSQSGGQWTVSSMGSLWESIRGSTPVAASTYDDLR